MTPTHEQQLCYTAATSTEDNLLISALAGAAKTTTLVGIAERLENTQVLCLAFNKRIATEMSQRLPRWCEAKTLNGLGHRAWADTLGRFLKLDARKNYNNLKKLVDDLPSEERGAAYETFADTLRSIAFGKSCGYIPDGHYTQKAKPLMGDADFRGHLEEDPTELEWHLIREATLMSLEQAWKGIIDFDDQILMPTVFSAIFPRYPLVMVDEAQDLSALNHAMLGKIARKRLIAVGDACQSIYGFRGAHQDSMNVLKRTFQMMELTLSISFRCPISVVEAARWRAPHMQWPEWAQQGEVRRLREWSVEDLPDSAAILCRNNAPIFSMAIKLLKNGRYPQIIGSDLGKTLIKLMKGLGNLKMSQEDALLAVETWKARKLEKSRDPGKINDQADCMRIFIQQGATLGDAIAYAEHILLQHGPIQLSTIHKAKGLEYDNVFILDKHLLRMNEQQDKNLLYVAQTRAKQTLTYVDSANFFEEVDMALTPGV